MWQHCRPAFILCLTLSSIFPHFPSLTCPFVLPVVTIGNQSVFNSWPGNFFFSNCAFRTLYFKLRFVLIMLVYRCCSECCGVFSSIAVCVFVCSSLRQQQATVLFCVCEWCDVFMEPFLRMELTSSGVFYFCVCAICVCERACFRQTVSIVYCCL